MKLIDEELGGTTPLNVIIKFPKKSEEDDLDDDWGEEDEDDSKYWFTRDKIDKITLVHDYLDGHILFSNQYHLVIFYLNIAYFLYTHFFPHPHFF